MSCPGLRWLRALTAAFALCLPPASWAELPPGEAALKTPAILVKAPDRVTLIAVTTAGTRLVAVGEHGVIIYSDDNGASWRQGQVPVDVTLTAVKFANPRDGWAAGHEGVILRSTDGGATWRLQLNGDQVNQLTLAAAQIAVAANDPSPGTARAMLRANHFLAGGPENPFLAILVTDKQTALVFGAYRMAMKTADGGATWADWTLHVGDPISHNLYDVARVGADIYLAGEAGSVFRSSDGGASFAAVTVPAQSTLFDVLPTGDGGVFVCGVAGLAFRSADHGNSWQAVNLNTQSNLTAGVVLSSGALVVGDEAGTLHISHDHGKSFLAMPEVQPMEIFGLTQAADGDVIAVGNTGVIVIPAKDFSQS
jgi:photosystem II stability/assembly factor-like uncharacterized protein